MYSTACYTDTAVEPDVMACKVVAGVLMVRWKCIVLLVQLLMLYFAYFCADLF